ncbi:TolC family protein, partial [bacterium]
MNRSEKLGKMALPFAAIAALLLCPALALAENQKLFLSEGEAVMMAFQNNRAFAVQKYNPLINRQAEEVAYSSFDPLFSGKATLSKSRADYPGPAKSDEKSLAVTSSLEKKTPDGLTLAAEGSATVAEKLSSIRFGASASQPLMRGRGEEANLYEVRMAGLDTSISEYEVRALAQSTAFSAVEAYWNHHFAAKSVAIYEESLRLARQNEDETALRIEAGKTASVELVTAKAETALCAQDLIDAQSALEKARIALIRVISPKAEDPFSTEINSTDEPARADGGEGALLTRIENAKTLRPEANQARIALKKGDLRVAKTKNGLLPRLDFFLSLGKSGY